MNNKLNKKYGLFTAICMVVGIVIGSGVFFKAKDVLNYTNGNMVIGIIAWIIGGIVMMICAYNFANFATQHEKVNGLVDYSEAIVSKKYGYFVGWFASTIYFPAMTSVLAWVSARYTLVIFGLEDPTTGLCIAVGAFYLIAVYALNLLSPKLAGKFQVSSTIIKMIPLIIMAVVGIIAGLINGSTVEAFNYAPSGEIDRLSVLSGVVACAFAYEGWIIATSINSELKDSKKNLPIALVIGTAIIMIIYIIYFISLTGGAGINDLMTSGSPSAFKNLFGTVGASIFNVLVVISCLGTLNGLILASTRSLYSISVRNLGPKPEAVSEVSKSTNMPYNSGIIALLLCGVWFFYFYAANLSSVNVFGVFSFDSSELPIITIYGMYIPILFMYILKKENKNIFKDIIMPILGIIASLFMMAAAVYAHGIKPFIDAKLNGNFAFPILFYLIIFVVVMIIGRLVRGKVEE